MVSVPVRATDIVTLPAGSLCRPRFHSSAVSSPLPTEGDDTAQLEAVDGPEGHCAVKSHVLGRSPPAGNTETARESSALRQQLSTTAHRSIIVVTRAPDHCRSFDRRRVRITEEPRVGPVRRARSGDARPG